MNNSNITEDPVSDSELPTQPIKPSNLTDEQKIEKRNTINRIAKFLKDNPLLQYSRISELNRILENGGVIEIDKIIGNGLFNADRKRFSFELVDKVFRILQKFGVDALSQNDVEGIIYILDRRLVEFKIPEPYYHKSKVKTDSSIDAEKLVKFTNFFATKLNQNPIFLKEVFDLIKKLFVKEA